MPHHQAPGLLQQVSGSREKIFGLTKSLFELSDSDTPSTEQVQICLRMLESYTAQEASNRGLIDAKQALEDLRAALPSIQQKIAEGRGDELLKEIDFLLIGSEIGGMERSFKGMHVAVKALRLDAGQALSYQHAAPGSGSGIDLPSLRSADPTLRSAKETIEPRKQVDATQEGTELKVLTTSIGLVQAGIDIGYQASYLVSIGLLKRDIANDKARLEELETTSSPTQEQRTEMRQLQNDLPGKEAELAKLQQESKYLFTSTTLLDLGRLFNFSGAMTAILGSAKDSAIGIASASLAGVGMGALFGAAALKSLRDNQQRLKAAGQELAYISDLKDWKTQGSEKVKELKGLMCDSRADYLAKQTRKDLKVSILRNALYAASSFGTVAVGGMKIAAAAGLTTLGGAIAATGIGITVLFLSALVIGVGYLIYKNREAIGTWIKLKTTWKFREWRLSRQLNGAKELAKLQLKIAKATSKPGGFSSKMQVWKNTYSRWRAQRAFDSAFEELKKDPTGAGLAHGCQKAAEELLAANKALDKAQAVSKQVSMHAKVEDRQLKEGLTKALDEITTDDEAREVLKELAQTGPFSDLAEGASRALRSTHPQAKLKELIYDWVGSSPQVRGAAA